MVMARAEEARARMERAEKSMLELKEVLMVGQEGRRKMWSEGNSNEKFSTPVSSSPLRHVHRLVRFSRSGPEN